MAFENHDSPLYFRAARKAARMERAGDYYRAAKGWITACRLARHPHNQIWSEHRSDFCITQVEREKLKASAMKKYCNLL